MGIEMATWIKIRFSKVAIGSNGLTHNRSASYLYKPIQVNGKYVDMLDRSRFKVLI